MCADWMKLCPQPSVILGKQKALGRLMLSEIRSCSDEDVRTTERYLRAG